MPAGPAALATLLLRTTPFVNYRCFSHPLLVPLCWYLLFLLCSSPCQCWRNLQAGPGGAQLRAHQRGSMPHSSKAEGRHCPWVGETSVAQGTPLQRTQTLAGTNLTDCSLSSVPTSCETGRDNPWLCWTRASGPRSQGRDRQVICILVPVL